MRSPPFVWVLGVLSSLLATTPASWAAEARKSFDELVGRPVVYAIPGMDQVDVRADLKYASATDPNLLMDVYVPGALAPGERRPVVMFIHGGAGSASRPKDWGIYRSWGRIAAASGFVGVTFTHRLGFPKPLLQESATDVADAIAYVRSHAADLRADPDRICLAAYSAGGPMLTVGLEARRPYIRCLVAFYAFLDVQQSNLHREHEPSDRVRAFSPITHLQAARAQSIPWFIARAGLDEIPTMNDSIDRFIAEAIARNVNVTILNHPQGVHGFDNQNDDDRSKEIIAAALAFMRHHLRTR